MTTYTMDHNNFKFKVVSLNIHGMRTFEKKMAIFNSFLKMPTYVFYKRPIAQRRSKTSLLNAFLQEWRKELKLNKSSIYGNTQH